MEGTSLHFAFMHVYAASSLFFGYAILNHKGFKKPICNANWKHRSDISALREGGGVMVSSFG